MTRIPEPIFLSGDIVKWRPRPRRPGYREAVEWIAGNDDCHWLGDAEPCISVAAAMVRDLFDVEDLKLFSDLRRALKRIHPNHEALK